MSNRRDDKTNSEHNLAQSCAYGCIYLPCLLSFDIYFSFNMYFTKHTNFFLLLIHHLIKEVVLLYPALNRFI